MIRPLALLLAMTVTAYADNERTMPHWPDTLAPVAKQAKKPQVKGWVRHTPPRTIIKKDVVAKPEKIDDVGQCRAPIEALGDIVHTWDNGKASARKAWMERVRWIYGERFMEHKLARDMHYQCNRVDVPKTEGILGAAANEATHALRCEVRAAPCAAPIVRDDK